MIRGKCPICAKAFEVASILDLPTFPFCSNRCRLVDLGRWIDGSYQIPGQESAAPGQGQVSLDDDGDS